MKNISVYSTLLISFSMLFSYQAIAAPGMPHIARMPTTYDAPAQYTVTWNMWWGNNGNIWYLLENGRVIHTGALTLNGQKEQSGQYTVNQASGGTYDYQVILCDATVIPESCSQSSIKTITVNGSSVNQPLFFG